VLRRFKSSTIASTFQFQVTVDAHGAQTVPPSRAPAREDAATAFSLLPALFRGSLLKTAPRAACRPRDDGTT